MFNSTKKKTQGSLLSKDTPDTLFINLHNLAVKCWEREWGWFGDGVVIKTQATVVSGNIIEARRYASDIGTRQPFIEITLIEHNNGTKVEIIEGGDHNPLTSKSLAPEITSWVNGSSKCTTNK